MLRGCSLYREKKKEIMIYGTFFLHSISSHDDLINMTVRSPELLEGIDFAFPFLSLWRLWKAQFHVLIQTNCVQFSAWITLDGSIISWGWDVQILLHWHHIFLWFFYHRFALYICIAHGRKWSKSSWFIRPADRKEFEERIELCKVFQFPCLPIACRSPLRSTFMSELIRPLRSRTLPIMDLHSHGRQNHFKQFRQVALSFKICGWQDFREGMD